MNATQLTVARFRRRSLRLQSIGPSTPSLLGRWVGYLERSRRP
jgi:hypothetical protein